MYQIRNRPGARIPQPDDRELGSSLGSSLGGVGGALLGLLAGPAAPFVMPATGAAGAALGGAAGNELGKLGSSSGEAGQAAAGGIQLLGQGARGALSSEALSQWLAQQAAQEDLRRRLQAGPAAFGRRGIEVG